MSSAESLWESFVIMLLCIFGAILIIFAVGMPTEEANKQLILAGVIDVPQEWQTSDISDFFISIIYWIAYLMGFAGVVQFIYTSVRRTKYDVYGNPIED